MKRLWKLELQRISMRRYIIRFLITGFVILIFTYFIANTAQITQEKDFMSYNNIFLFTSVISILLFGIITAIMYNDIIIKEYSGNRLLLLLSYPIDRRKLFLVKILLIYGLSMLSMLICTGIPILIFSISESYFHIVSDTITLDLLFHICIMLAVSALFTGSVGILSMAAGFVKKSITTTLIISFLLCTVFANLLIGVHENTIVLILSVLTSCIFTIIVIIQISRSINNMEVN